MSPVQKYLNKPIGEKERGISMMILLVFVLLCLIGDFFLFFGIDACYDGFFADFSEKYARSCENIIRESCSTKHGLDQVCVQYMKTHTPLNILIGRAFILADFAMLLVHASRNIFAAIISGFAIIANFSFMMITQIYYAETFFASLTRPFVMSAATILYLYFLSLVLREQLHKRLAA